MEVLSGVDLERSIHEGLAVELHIDEQHTNMVTMDGMYPLLKSMTFMENSRSRRVTGDEITFPSVLDIQPIAEEMNAYA